MNKFRLLITCFLIFSVLPVSAQVFKIGMFKPSLSEKIAQKDYTIAMTLFVQEFLNGEDLSPEFIYYDNRQQMADDFKHGKIIIAVAAPLIFVELFNKEQLTNGMMGYKVSKEDSNILVLLGQKNDQRSLKEKLSGTIAHNHDLSIERFLQTTFLEYRITPLQNKHITLNSQQSILNLFFKKADIALVDQASYKMAIELNPQIEQQLVILQSVPLILNTIAFISTDAPPELRDKILKSALALNDTERGHQLLRLFKATKMDITLPEDLNPLYKLNIKYHTLLQNTAQRKSQ